MYLRAHPLCARCGGPATEVNHLHRLQDNPDLALDPEHCEALCKSCHAKHTVEYDGWLMVEQDTSRLAPELAARIARQALREVGL